MVNICSNGELKKNDYKWIIFINVTYAVRARPSARLFIRRCCKY